MMESERGTRVANLSTAEANASDRRLRRLWFGVLSSALCVSLACSSDKKQPTTQPTTQPTSVRERQDAALRDPFGYKPDFESRDVSGGKITEFDGAGMKKDIDHVLNP